MSLLENITKQISVIFVNVVFFVLVIHPLRFSRKITGLATIIVFSLTSLPCIFFSDLFSSGAAASPKGMTFHYIYWIITMVIQYSLFFILLKRDWLRNMMLYVIWDIIIALLLSLSAVIIQISLPNIQLSGLTGALCTVTSAFLAAFLLRRTRLQDMRLPDNFCIIAVFVYSIGRLLNTISVFRFEKENWKELVIYPVFTLILCLSIVIVFAYFGMNVYINKKCCDIAKIYLAKERKNNNAAKLFYDLSSLCKRQKITFTFQISPNTTFPNTNGSILYAIQILFELSRKYTGRQCENIFFEVQEYKGFFILSSLSIYPNASDNVLKKFVSTLQNIFLEILFNRIVKNCRGYVEYIDNSLYSKHIRVIIPLPLNTGA